MADSGFIRKVAFAVRLADPISGATLSAGLRPVPKGADGKPFTARPIVNASGIFVWTEGRGVAWPRQVKVESALGQWVGFEQEVPPPVPDPKPRDRLITLALRPSAAFVPETGVTALRGRLFDRPGGGGTAIAGALVRLVAGSGGALPPVTPAAEMVPAAGAALTAEDGAFIVFARSPSQTFAATADDQVRLRLLVTVASPPGAPMTRGTAPGFEFLPGQPGAAVPDGRFLPHEYTLFWSDLRPA